MTPLCCSCVGWRQKKRETLNRLTGEKGVLSLFPLLKILHKLDHHLLPFLMPKSLKQSSPARRIAEKAVAVADLDERVNRAVTAANRAANAARVAAVKCLAGGARRWCRLEPQSDIETY
ncbi:hypothetical protein Tco_0829967 [Tanacetum coccineum]